MLDQRQIDLPLPEVRRNERYQRGQRRGHGAASDSGGGAEEAPGVAVQQCRQRKDRHGAVWTTRRERLSKHTAAPRRAKIEHTTLRVQQYCRLRHAWH